MFANFKKYISCEVPRIMQSFSLSGTENPNDCYAINLLCSFFLIEVTAM